MNHLIRKSPGKEQQEVIFWSFLTLLPLRLAKQEWCCLLGGCCSAWPLVSKVLWVLSRGSGHEPQSHLLPLFSKPSSCCRRSLHSQLCPHNPVLVTGRAQDPACVSIAAFHWGMKCHFGVVVSTQTALLGKNLCTIASFQQPNTPFPQIWKQNFRL